VLASIAMWVVSVSAAAVALPVTAYLVEVAQSRRAVEYYYG